jgi:hypothetical protein
MRKLVALALFGVSVMCRADPMCERFAQAIEDGQKELAFHDISVLGESGSAESSRLQAKVVDALLIQTNVQLAAAHKCQPQKLPIDDSAYSRSAWACRYAKPSPSAPATAGIPECDRSKWTRNAAK